MEQVVNKLEHTLSKMQNHIAAFQQKNKELTTSVDEMDNSLTFMNNVVEELKIKETKHLGQIKQISEKIRYKEVYQRRKNLRYNGVPEEVMYHFLENKLGIDNA